MGGHARKIAVSNCHIVYTDDLLPIEVYWSGFQIEKKPYPTPYVNGIREGIVKDYSPNNRDATLELSTTPRWVEEGFANSGAYEFNGTNTYIKVVDSNYFNMNDKITLSAWIKHKQTTGIIDCVAHFNGLRFYINKTNKLYIKFTTTSNDVTFTGSVPIDDSGNVWTHLVLTYDGSRVKGYINGVLDPNLDFSTSGLLRKSNIGYIGVFDAS